MTRRRLIQPIVLALGLALVGCGGDPGPTVAPKSTYSTTTSPYTDTIYSQTPYTAPATSGTPVVTTPATESSAVSPVKSGVEVQLISKELPGMFSWERCEARITVINHEFTPQQGFLIVSFTRKENEVEVQYKSLTLPGKSTHSFLLKSTVQADDAFPAFRTKLL